MEFFSLRTLGAWPGPPWTRVWGALAASFALHAGLVLLPDLGARSFAFDPFPASGRGLRAGPALEVSLRVREPPPDERVQAVAPKPGALESKRTPPPAREQPARNSPGGIDLLPIPAHYFHARDELTRPARPEGVPNFDMAAMGPAFRSGSVVLKVYIDAVGTVVAVQVEKSEVPRALADGAAAAFRALHFRPGEMAGRRVASFTRYEVTFVDGAGVSVRGLAR